MNNQQNAIWEGATINPGDFVLGSPESRAAARVLHKAKHSMSDDDLACWLVWQTASLKAPATPASDAAKATPVYARGWEIEQQKHPIIPSHLDPMYGKHCLSCYVFRSLHFRWPNNGDVLRYSELQSAFDPADEAQGIELFRQAWKAKLPSIVFPLKWEGRRIYCHQRNCISQRMEWKESVHHQPAPECEWRTVEYDVLDYLKIPARGQASGVPMPITPAVMFEISANGKWHVKPYTQA